MDKIERALLNHKNGYNCAQAVVCTYCNMFGVEEKTAFRLAESFGLGMGGMETCGVVTAMAMVTGMKESDGNMSAPSTKKICYGKMKKMLGAFKEKNGTVICRELKGTDTGKPLRSCDGCIQDAVSIIEDYLINSI